jgi:hypothetical protein
LAIAGAAAFASGETPKTIVDPLSGSAGFDAGLTAAGFATGDWPNTIVAPVSGSVFGLALLLRFPVWNIIVRPAPSSVGGAVGAGLAAEAADGAGFGAAAAGFATGDWPNTIVACGEGSGGRAAGLGAAAALAGPGAVAAGSRVTVKTF